MRTIHKFPVNVTDEFTMEMPKGAEVLSVQVQASIDSPDYKRVMMWAIVDTEAPVEKRTFYVRGTSHPCPENVRFIGTFQLLSNQLVFHLMEPK